MRKILLILSLFVAAFVNMHAGPTQETDGDVVFHRTIPDDDTKDYPRMPAYSPIYGMVSGDLLTIYSKAEGEANVTVADATGTVIMSQPVADLTCGYTVMLPAEKTGLKVSVLFNGVTYSANL